MKRIAINLMEAIGPSKVRRRLNPENFLEHEFDSDYIIFWDYSNFTSSLADLRHFLWYVAEGLKETAVYDLRLFDYHLGDVRVHPSELLHSYNEIVNLQSPYSLHRILGKWGVDLDQVEATHQNGGPLGVAGNIGFATANHSFVIACEVGEDKSVVVGDDAKAISSSVDNVIRTVNQLGDIAVDKFGIIPPGSTEWYRFLKRGWYRTEVGSLIREFLYDLPIINFVDQEFGQRTVPPTENMDEYCLRRVVSTISTLLWTLFRTNSADIPDLDVQILSLFLRAIYRYMSIPPSGCLPGYFNSKTKQVYTMAVPCIEFDKYDPRSIDWLEQVLASHRNDYCVKVSILIPKFEPPRPDKGDIFYGPESTLYKALEDLGYVAIRRCYEYVAFLSEDSKRAIRIALKTADSDLRPMYEYTCLRDIPAKFDFAFTDPNVVYKADISNIL